MGDLTPGHNQVPIALADGAKVGIAIHMDLREFPRDLDELEETGPVHPDEVPGIPETVVKRAVDSRTNTGS